MIYIQPSGSIPQTTIDHISDAVETATKKQGEVVEIIHTFTGSYVVRVKVRGMPSIPELVAAFIGNSTEVRNLGLKAKCIFRVGARKEVEVVVMT